jgi:hypothetical protein
MFIKSLILTAVSFLALQAYATPMQFSTNREAYSFTDIKSALDKARQYGVKEVVFAPPQKKQVQSIALSDEDIYGAGDLVILEGGMTNSESDSMIRYGDYEAVYRAVARAGFARMRVVINMMATTLDLKKALQATRPTFLIWSGHGGENGFAYDASQALIPADTYKNMSPMIYKYVHATCHGDKALENYKFNAKISKYWTGLTGSDDLKDYMDSTSLMNGRQFPMNYKGYACIKTGEDGTQGFYDIVNSQGVKINTAPIIGGEPCAAMLFNGYDGFMCTNTKYGYDVVSLKTGQVLKGVSFGKQLADLYTCNSKIHASRNGTICRRDKNENGVFVMVRSQDGSFIEGQTYKTLDSCTSALKDGAEL